MEPIRIPEHAEGSGLRVLPEGPAVLMLEKMKAAVSKSSNEPMIVATFVVAEEMPDADPNEEPTIGTKLVEYYSLSAKALFKIGQDYKAIAGESIPQGDYATTEDLIAVVGPVMAGSIWDAILGNEIPPGQTEPRTKIVEKVYRG